MRVSRMFAALRLLLSDTLRHGPIRVGIEGLRHKPRHNAASAQGEGEAVVWELSDLVSPARSGTPGNLPIPAKQISSVMNLHYSLVRVSRQNIPRFFP